MKKTFWATDTETSSKDAYKAIIFAIAWCDSEGNATVIRFDGEDGSDPVESRKRAQEFLSDTSKIKIVHNLKYDLTVLLMNGFDIPPETIWHDTMMMSRILRNLNPFHDIGYLAWELCGWPQDLDKEIEALGKQLGGYQYIPEPKMREYQIGDVQRAMLLFHTFWEEVRKDTALILDYQREMQLIFTTQKIEEFGIDIDKRECNKLINWLDDELDTVREQTYRLFGEFINWGADEQVKRILFKRLGFPILEVTDNGGPSTDKDIIQALMQSHPHPVHELILKHRSYTSGRTYIKSYLAFAGEEGVIRPNINTCQAKTSRQSSSRPNMQNTAKEVALKNLFPVPARRCFRARLGYIILFVDYAGIEMRLIVDASGEKEMMDAIITGSHDVHVMAAETFYGDLFLDRDRTMKHFLTTDARLKQQFKKLIDTHGKVEAADMMYAKFRKALRDAAKNGSFAIAYGAGANKLSLTISLPPQEAKKALERYRERFPKVANFTKQMAGEVKEFGYITDAFGVKKYVPKNKAHVGANYRIQRDAAVILKIAENRVDQYSRENWDYKIRLQMPVHDELIIAYPRILLPHLNETCKEIGKLMTSIEQIKVPLEVEWKKSTTNWASAKKFSIV